MCKTIQKENVYISMSIIQKIDQYHLDSVYFCDSIKNNVMTNGNFIRILYCTPCFTMNGVYIHVKLSDITYEKYYQKYKCFFDTERCGILVSQINRIEREILDKVSSVISDKTPQYKIAEQLSCGFIKIFCDVVPKQPNSSFVLKISGIWETDTNYGLTYKFSKINDII